MKKIKQTLLNTKEEEMIVSAIGKAEQKTSGEIHVHISTKHCKRSVLDEAINTFNKLGMSKTKNRNGVIIYISEPSKKLAIYGDEGIHKFIEQSGWDEIVLSITSAFKKGDFGVGILNAIQKVAAKLEKHFPRSENDNDQNELPDDISSS